MAHAQKPDFVFRRNGRVHLNRWGRQFSRLLAAEVCASAVVMLDTPCSEVEGERWLPTPFASFPFTSPPVRHRVPSGFKRTVTHLAISHTTLDMKMGKCFTASNTCRPQMTPQRIICKLTSLQLFYCNIDTEIINS